MAEQNGIVESLERTTGHIFSDKALARRALSHTSYAYSTGMRRQESNERLEYLGDALLRAYVARHLFLQYPEEDEGALSRKSAKALSGKALSKAAKAMGLNLLALFSPQEEATGGRGKERNLAGCFEAVTAAIYLDAGQAALESFLNRHLEEQIAEELSDSERDPKSALQEEVQAGGRALPVYKLVEKRGPQHSPTFFVEVFDESILLGSGSGGSMKEAEQAAASDALSKKHFKR